jgi:hypothetical protein
MVDMIKQSVILPNDRSVMTTKPPTIPIGEAMLRTAIGFSDNIDHRQAITETLDQCQAMLGATVPQAGIFFTSLLDGDFSFFLNEIKKRFPTIELIGCTTDGEIVPGRGFVEDAVALLLLASDHLCFAGSVARDLSRNGADALVTAVEACRARLPDEPSFGIILPDGLSTIDLPLATMMHRATGSRFPLFGGTAGDHYRLQTTYQFHEGQVYSDAAPLLLCSGPVTITSRVLSGNEPIGRFYEVTSADKNIIREIDGRPAADFYRELLGSYAKDQAISQLPLAIYEYNNHEFCLRDPWIVDEQSGTVSCIGTFPERCRIRLTSISREDILRTAREANEATLHRHPGGPPELILLFPCTSRRHVLGSMTNDEFAVLFESKKAPPFFGFYCYGEIGPPAEHRPTLFHSDTYIAVGLSEPS